MKAKAPRCAACGRAIPYYEPDIPKAISWPEKRRGRAGDGLVCGHLCGYRLAMRLVEQVPGVLALLTPSLPDPRAHAEEQEMRRRASVDRLPVPTPSGGTVTVIGNSFANDSPRARRRHAEELVSMATKEE